jgi:hypothetical protein
VSQRSERSESSSIRQSRASEDAGPRASARQQAGQTKLPLGPDDFYMEGAFLVFTAAYHLRRGYCCNSDCRHCPFKELEQ